MLVASTSRILRRAAATAPRSSSIAGRRYASHGEPHYNEPTGYLFGEKPPAPGQKRQKEDWEGWWSVFVGAIVLSGVGLYYKPDTSIQGWALEEAKQRMEARGEKYQYESSTPSS